MTKLAAADHDLCLFGFAGLPEGTAADVAGAIEPHRHVLREGFQAKQKW